MKDQKKRREPRPTASRAAAQQTAGSTGSRLRGIDWVKLIVSLATPAAVGALTAVLTKDKTGPVYAALRKPPLSPPGEVFPWVWAALYLLMGIALYLAWSSRHEGSKTKALSAFFVQLALNAAWPLVFFLAQDLLLSAVIALALLFAVAVAFTLFRREARVAGLLLLPYLLWAAFAAYLSLGVALLN